MEESLIEHLTDFLLELGDDFTFLGRQRRLRIDDTWFRIDLVFFHRRLRCLLIVELLCGRPHNSSWTKPLRGIDVARRSVFRSRPFIWQAGSPPK
jgi:predicted nuclease of restriction endonuclease-like (RecB) superfamily